jgi:hypothetical protein
MAIEQANFREWFKAHLEEHASDIARHGADAGYPHITYTIGTVEIFNAFEDEIWEMANQDADDMGCKNVAEFISGFSRADMLGTFDQFKNLMVWYACEKVARETEEG